MKVEFAIQNTYAQQKQAAWWHSYKSAINFNQNPPALNRIQIPLRLFYANGSISDKNGNLLYYSDGFNLRNANNTILKGGSDYGNSIILSLSDTSQILYSYPGAATRTGFAEFPGHPTKFFFFYQTFNGTRLSSFKYLIIEGDSVIKPQNDTLIRKSGAFCLGFIRHSNEKDYYIVAPDAQDSTLKVFKLDSTGIRFSSQERVRFGGLRPADDNWITFGLAVAPNSSKLVFSTGTNFNFFNINRTTGELSFIFQDKIYWRGLDRSIHYFAISPNSTYLYLNQNTVRQYNLNSTDSLSFRASERIIIPQRIGFGDVQLAMNGKIYISWNRTIFRPYLGVINCPDEEGLNCNPDTNGLFTPYESFASEFPCQNQTFLVNAGKFQAMATRDTICAGDSVSLSAFGASIDRFRWVNAAGNTIDTNGQIKVAPIVTTRYRVFGTGTCRNKDTNITITVANLPDLGLPDSVVYCYNNVYPIAATFPRISGFRYTYRWSTGATTVNIVPTDTGWYWLEVSNGYCSRRDSVRVLGFETPPQAVVNTPNSILCNESSTAIAANNPNNNPSNRWRIIQGSGTIENVNNPETRISNLPFGITKLVWEVAASRAVNCFSSDTLTIERRRLPVSNIIGRRNICPGLPESVYRADTSLIRSNSIVWNVKKGEILSVENNNSLIRIQWQDALTDSAEVNLFAFGKNDCPMADTLRFRVRVSPNLLPEPVLSTDTIFCFSDSSFVFSIADPQPTTTYQWQAKNAEIVGSSTSNSVQISWRNFRKSNLSNPDSLPQVWYSERIETPITVCNGVSDTFRIRYQSDPTLAWQADTFTCSNKAILIPTASNTPDSDSLLNGTTFTWQPSTNLSNPISLQTSFLFPQNQFRNGQSDTTLQYIRTTRTAKGCLFVDTVNIKVFGRLQAIAFSLDSSLCLNDAQEIIITNFNDSLNYFFAISSDTVAVNNLLFNPLNNSDTLLPQNRVGNFKITIFNLNKNGCSSDTIIKFYTINPLPNPDLSGNNKYICPNFLSNIPYRVQGKPGSSFSWSVTGGRAISDTGSQVLVNWDNVELRSLQVTETDSNGCITQSEPFDILLDKNVDIPESGCKLSDYPLVGGNILTLNGDGINEQITFRNINLYGSCQLLIYNRYGTPIISIPNYQEVNNYTPNSLAEGMYYYQLQSARAVVKGWLVVVR